MKKLRRKNNNLVEAPFPRRLGASLIDLGVTLVIGLLAYLVNDVALNQTPYVKKADFRLYEIRVASGLYINDSEAEKTYIREEPIYENNNEDFYLSSLEYFYLEAKDSPSGEPVFVYEKSSFYNEELDFNFYVMVLDMNKEGTVFDFVMNGDQVENYHFKNGISNEQKQTIWNDLYSEAISEFEVSPLYLAARNPMTTIFFVNIVLSLLLGALPPYLLMPLLLGNGQTIGKYVCGLALVNAQGFKIKRWQVVIRYLFLGGIELGASVPLYAIPLFLTSASLTVTHGARTFHDFIAKTYVVDAYESKIFLAQADEDKYHNSLVSERDKARIEFFKMARRNAHPTKKG